MPRALPLSRSPDIHAPAHTRLPVLKLFLRTYRRVWRSLPALARFAAMPFALLFILEGGVRHAAGVSETWIDVTILASLQAVLQAAILTPITIEAYRLFMFGRRAVRADTIDDFPPGTTHVLAISLAFAVALLPFGDMLTLMDYETAMMPSVALGYHAFVAGGLVLYVLVLVRSVFLFNYACMGHDLNLSLAWRQTAGNGWRLLGLILLVQLPVMGAAAALESWALRPLGEAIDFGTWMVWPGLFGEAVALVLTAILLAATGTFAYAHLTGFPVPDEHADASFQRSLPFDF